MEQQAGKDIVKRHVNLILKKKVLFVITAISIITAFVIVSYTVPKKYKAQSTVFIERNVISSLIEGIAITPSMEERLRVLAYSIKSRSLLLKVVDALDIDLNTENQAEIDGIIKGFQKNTSIKITSRRGGRADSMEMFIISYINSNPELARDYVNTLIRLYIEENLFAKREEAYGANTFLSNQIKYFKDKLDKIDEKIINFRKEKGIFIAIDESRIVQDIKNVEERLEELGIMKKELEAQRDLIEKNLGKEDPYTVAILGGSNSSISNRIIMLQNRLNELLLNYTEHYPEVLRLKAEIEFLNERLKSGSTASYSEGTGGMSTLNPVYLELKEKLSKTKIELAGVEVREKQLKKLVESKKKYLRDIPLEKKKLADFEEEKGTNKGIYEKLVLRLGQSEVSKQMEIQDKGATFRIVDPAILPTVPVNMNRAKRILLGIFAGFAGAFGLILLLDNMDTSVKTVDVLKTLKLPVLAIIPRIHTKDELKSQRAKDIRLYAFAGIFMLCVLGVLAIEFLNS